MSRGALILIVVIVVLIGGAWLLSSRAHPVPLTKIETDVARQPNAQ